MQPIRLVINRLRKLKFLGRPVEVRDWTRNNSKHLQNMHKSLKEYDNSYSLKYRAKIYLKKMQ